MTTEATGSNSVRELLLRIGCKPQDELRYPATVRFVPDHSYFELRVVDFTEVLVQSECLIDGLDDLAEMVGFAINERIVQGQFIPRPSNRSATYWVTVAEETRSLLEWYWANKMRRW